MGELAKYQTQKLIPTLKGLYLIVAFVFINCFLKLISWNVVNDLSEYKFSLVHDLKLKSLRNT